MRQDRVTRQAYPYQSCCRPLVGFLLSCSAFVINNYTLMLALVLVISVLFNILNRSGKFGHTIATQAFAGIVWSAALMFVHRSSYLFIPIVIASWLFYVAAAHFISEGRPVVLKTLRIIALLLPCICIAILASVLATRLGYLQQPAVNANRLFSHVTSVLMGARSGTETKCRSVRVPTLRPSRSAA